ncbi:MAG TPA: AAA family ATPase [Chthoniobacterales bacterium]
MLEVDLPFEGEKPKPLVLVGRNGSGKSTVLSFVVNALVGMKQEVFEDVEVEKGRVYRMRSPLGIRSGANYFSADLLFQDDVRLREWQLDRPRETFETALGWTPTNASWNQIPQHEATHYSLTFGTLNETHKLEKALSSNCLLFFPADRFEPPDWLNAESLSNELKLPEPSRMKGRTARRIFSRNRLKPTMEWLTAVLLDMLLHEHQPAVLPVQPPGVAQPLNIPVRIAIPGASTATFNAVVAVLKEILSDEPGDQVQLSLTDRRSRIISATVLRDGKVIRSVNDLLSLSAGESALFCLFATIVLDADLAGMPFTNTNDIRGIVLIDEADLHLHLGLQHDALPKLFRLFPRVQFILTVHSPLVVLGMESQYGPDGFVVLELPSGVPINPESYSEFVHAFDVFAATRKFESEVLSRLNAQPKPALLVEGISDAILIANAWEKLNPGVPIQYEVIPCGVEPLVEARSGGAEMLRRCLEFLAIASDRTIMALFDNDRSGNEQFLGVSGKAFQAGQDAAHKKHKLKPAHAIVLPVPPGREAFVTAGNPVQRYLSIEHYFSDQRLTDEGMKGAAILGTPVFEIVGNKVVFAKKSAGFPDDEFAPFAQLFNRIAALI